MTLSTKTLVVISEGRRFESCRALSNGSMVVPNSASRDRKATVGNIGYGTRQTTPISTPTRQEHR
jgi:hypothetical protein